MKNKFSLTVNDQSHEGFKMSFTAEDPETLKIFESLAKALIEKITKIEVTVSNNEY